MISARKRISTLLVPGIVLLLWMAAVPSPLTAQTTMLHSFDFTDGEGMQPYGDVLIIGTTMYGMTSSSGSTNRGVVFKMETDGSAYEVLHQFTGEEGDGCEPHGSLITDGSALYGMTYWGGLVTSSSSGLGVVFKINFDGTGYTHLHEFGGFPAGDGAYPWGSLVLGGTTLYGMTISHGTSWGGTIFKVETDGSGYQNLHHFPSSYPYHSGWSPYGSLIIDGTTLYGTTSHGGDGSGTDYGTVFSVQTNGSGYTTLHVFQSVDGHSPQDTLLRIGSTLYGTTMVGGAYSGGVVFSLETDGSGFQLLHEFDTANEGYRPKGALALAGGTLYGMTSNGGYLLYGGHIFSINPDGSGYEEIHEFTGCNADPLLADGKEPQGSLVADGSTLYGMSRYGGFCPNDDGAIFALPLTPVTIDASFSCVPDSGIVPFQSSMTVEMFNLYDGQTRRMAGRIDLTLANGSFYTRWRAGFTNVAAGDSHVTSWMQSIPALGSLVGTNSFQLVAEDVTPAPFNQPPHPAAGQTATAVCTVEGLAP